MEQLAVGRVTQEVTGTRRVGWLLAGAFISAIALLMLIGFTQTTLEEEVMAIKVAAMEAHGGFPSAEELARVTSQFGPASPAALLIDLSALTPMVLLLLAAAQHRHIVDGKLTQLAIVCAGGAFVGWIVLSYLNTGLRFGPDNLPPLVSAYPVIYGPIGVLVTWLGFGAIIGMALGARQASVAPRVALATTIITGLLWLIDVPLAISSGFVISLPPLVPLIPGLILGIGLMRTGARP